MIKSAPYRRIAIGFGCSSSAEGEEVVRLIRASVDQIPADTLVATIDGRRAMGEAVSSLLGLKLVLFSSAVLAEVQGITTRSAIALAQMQTASVAEAAALAALGPGARLVVARTKGGYCTCAVAALVLEGNS